jgi:hypothetical protein
MMLLYCNNDTIATLQNFSARFHHYKVLDTIVEKDLVDSILPRHPPSVKGNLRLFAKQRRAKGHTFHVQ